MHKPGSSHPLPLFYNSFILTSPYWKKSSWWRLPPENNMQCSFPVSSEQAAGVWGRSTTPDWMCPVQTHIWSGRPEVFYPDGGFCGSNNAFQPWSENQAAALQTHRSLLTPLIWPKANKRINKPPHSWVQYSGNSPFSACQDTISY